MEESQKSGIQYITALSIEEIRCLINENVLQLNMFSKDLAEIEDQDARYILCTNPDLEKEHSQTREALKIRFENVLYDIKLSYDNRLQKNNDNKIRLHQNDKNKKLATQFSEKQLDNYKYRIRKALEINHMQSFYKIEITQEAFVVTFYFDKYTQAKQLDGKYVIVSNAPKEKMNKETVRAQYKNLKHVEHAFRDMKTMHLDIRPIFHVNEATTRGHVFVCMLAYTIIREIENRIFPWLKQSNKSKKEQLSLSDIEEELKMIKLNILQINKHHEEIKITALTTRQKDIFMQLDIKPELMTM